MAPPMTPLTPSPYAQAQDDEIEALQAIYMDDYEEVEVKGAWNQTNDKAFRLTLKSWDDPDTFILLSVLLTATYPKSVPILAIEKTGKIREKTKRSVETMLHTLPKEHIGEVMIHEIASAIVDVLTNEVDARNNEAALPSLEQERTLHEAAAEKLAKEQEEEALRKHQEDKAEEDRVLDQMVQEEIAKKRREANRKPKTVPNLLSPDYLSVSGSNTFTFDRIIDTQVDGTDFQFTSVSLFGKPRKGPLTEVCSAEPIVSGLSKPAMLLKRVTIKSLASNSSLLKKTILDLEDEMEELKHLRHPNIIAIFDFKIEKVEHDWQISILNDMANSNSVARTLKNCGSLPVSRVRAWTIDLLEALDFYHRSGIVHKRIHAENVLLHDSSENEASTIKLGDAGFQDCLHQLYSISQPSKHQSTATTIAWIPSELNGDRHAPKSRKTDVWDLGVVFLQMLFGLACTGGYTSSIALMDSLDLTEPLEDIIRKFFKADPKKRPAAFDLMPCEFLRTDVEIHAATVDASPPRHSSGLKTPSRIRRESSTGAHTSWSKYANEWSEIGRLGKGGYGEVVKARNKLDGRTYAIKKLKQNSAAALTEVLPEVMLLSRLNNPYVVRYFTAWLEEDEEAFEDLDSSTLPDDTSTDVAESSADIDFSAASTGGLDFISSSGYPRIEFGDSSEDESDDDDNAIVFESDDDDGDDDLVENDKSPRSIRRVIPSPLDIRRASNKTPRTVKTTLYIQMEYCERHTLRDLIRKGLYEDPDECWRLFRQVLEGLVHIHSHGIIHRDLKPDNIFIDVTDTPRIGDFGLAKKSGYELAHKIQPSYSFVDSGMTRSIGTLFYVAPELKSSVGGDYNDKVDMYSLGIIFFEMCYPLKTLMERTQVIQALRARVHTLPEDFQSPEKALQGSIIMTLLSHKPSERPSSRELLHSGQLPVQIEDETIKEALKGISDPSSPYYQRMMSALFASSTDNHVKSYAWDIGDDVLTRSSHLSADLRLQTIVKNQLIEVFRRHGAEETQRQPLFPRSTYYTGNNVAQLLDANGVLTQLPYDLILPHARTVARQKPAVDRVFAFGHVFRDTHSGGAPRSTGEVDFDIVSSDTRDLALKEAEVVKVMDEVISQFPSLTSTSMCFHLNHASLLDLVLDFCRISQSQRPAVKEVLSKLNVQQWTWQKIRTELRSPTIGVSSMSLDDLAKFDWRDSMEKAATKLRTMFQGTDHLDKSQPVLAHLNAVVAYLKTMRVRRKVFLCPLSNFNEKFYTGGVLFQCLYDGKRRDVLAAGGRYDKLIEAHKPRAQGKFSGCHAVGMNIGWERLVASMSRYQKNAAKSTFAKKSTEDETNGLWSTRRCDILVASFDSATLRSSGLRLVAELWANELTAELAVDTRSPEELLAIYGDHKHDWIVMVKHDTAAVGKPDLKVKSMLKKEDTDMHTSGLLSYLRAEIRERNHRFGISSKSGRPDARFIRSHNSSDANGLPTQATTRSNVEVLTAEHRSKKTNKWAIIEGCQASARELGATLSSARAAAIETKDGVMELIRETRLSDPDSWRKVKERVPFNERGYIQDIHKMLSRYAEDWRNDGSSSEGRTAIVYNFRSAACFAYDLGL